MGLSILSVRQPAGRLVNPFAVVVVPHSLQRECGTFCTRKLTRMNVGPRARTSPHPLRRGCLDPAHENQDQQNDDHEAEAAAAVIAGAVKRSAAPSSEAAEQRDDQDNENYRSK